MELPTDSRAFEGATVTQGHIDVHLTSAEQEERAALQMKTQGRTSEASGAGTFYAHATVR